MDVKQLNKIMKTHSPSFLALENVVQNKKILADMKYLSKFFHTGNLEVFHSGLWGGQGKITMTYGMSRVKEQLSGKRSILYFLS